MIRSPAIAVSRSLADMASRTGGRRATATVALLLAPLAVLMASTAAARDGDYTAQTVETAPTEAPPATASLLQDHGYKVTGAAGEMGTFWFRKEMPTRTPDGQLGVDFGKYPVGALVGVVQIAKEWSDYRKRAVQPGTYTLRYGIQPANGDHTGQTYFRDFLLMVPIADDVFPPDGAEQDPIVEAGKKTTDTAHPGVMALYQIYDPVEAAGMVSNDYGEPCLAVPIAGLVMGIVVEGHGQSLPM